MEKDVNIKKQTNKQTVKIQRNHCVLVIYNASTPVQELVQDYVHIHDTRKQRHLIQCKIPFKYTEIKVKTLLVKEITRKFSRLGYKNRSIELEFMYMQFKNEN